MFDDNEKETITPEVGKLYYSRRPKWENKTIHRVSARRVTSIYNKKVSFECLYFHKDKTNGYEKKHTGEMSYRTFKKWIKGEIIGETVREKKPSNRELAIVINGRQTTVP